MTSDTTHLQNVKPQVVSDASWPSVQFVRGVDLGKRMVLEPGTNTVGRDPQSAIVLDVDGISRHHATFEVTQEGQTAVNDRASTNGTFVNGQRVVGLASLREGDQIQFGNDVVLRLAYGVREEFEAETRLKPAATGPASADPLSKREREIAILVAEGYSNLNIGAHLSISPRTVGSHLANIYKKLELHSRSGLTRWILIGS